MAAQGVGSNPLKPARRIGRRQASSTDVAKAAGVSRSTVSFVLNDRTDIGISEATRERVWAAARELGYTPSPEARALKLGRSAIVVCLMPDWPITGPLGVLLEQVSANLAQAGLTMLAHQRSPGDDLGQVLSALTPAHILVMCELSEAEIELAAQRGIDMTAFMTTLSGHPDRSSFRQQGVGALQIRVLVEHGHTTLGYVAAERGSLDWFSRPRLEGAKAEAKRLGAQFSHRTMRGDQDAALGRWLSKAVGAGVTAVAAYNDEVAFAVLMAAQGEGLTVPQDLSIIGVDDSAISRLARPALSTIRFALSEVAERLAAVITGTSETNELLPGEALHVQLRGSVRRA